MAIKVGESNFIIYKDKGMNWLRLQELFKWCASIVLLFYFLITFRATKGFMLLKIRYWVLKGIISKSN
jgi:hypothetical protein